MNSMRSHLGRLATVLLLTASLVACGGKSKAKTTPGSGSAGGSDAVGMKDGDDPDDPGGGGGSGDGGGAGDGGGSGDGGGAGDGGGDGDGGDGDEPEKEKPKFVPTNMDPDPEVAKTEVQSHIVASRNALKGDTPDPDLAISEAKEALKVDGTNIDAVVLIAHAYVIKKQYDTAETILDMLVKDRKDAAPKNASVYYVYGLVYDKINEPAKALKSYEKAVELRPKYPAALINLGVHQLRNKQYDAAMQTYELLTGELNNTDASTWSSLGSAYRGKSADYASGSAEQSSWLTKSETAYKRATTANKNYGPAYYNLGLLYLDADPMPDGNGGSMDTLVRLKQAKTYFDEYKNMPGVDITLYDQRMKDVTRLIKREEKRRK